MPRLHILVKCSEYPCKGFLTILSFMFVSIYIRNIGLNGTVNGNGKSTSSGASSASSSPSPALSASEQTKTPKLGLSSQSQIPRPTPISSSHSKTLKPTHNHVKTHKSDHKPQNSSRNHVNETGRAREKSGHKKEKVKPVLPRMLLLLLS